MRCGQELRYPLARIFQSFIVLEGNERPREQVLRMSIKRLEFFECLFRKMKRDHAYIVKDDIPEASDSFNVFRRDSRFLCISYASIYASIYSSHSAKKGRRTHSGLPLRMMYEGVFSFAMLAEFLWRSVVE